MKLSLIVAHSKNNVIGKNNQLPWHLPADLAHFKKITMGKPIIMGRKTFESIGKPLPGRRNMIITHDKNFRVSGCEIFYSIDDALAVLRHEAEIIVIGGATVFAQCIELADCIYLTVIDAELDGDTFFPALNDSWTLISEEKHTADEKNKYAYRFQMWENH